MLPEYRTIYRGGEDEIVEKKSRFIADGGTGKYRGRST